MKAQIKKWLLSRGIAMTRPPGQFNLFLHKMETAKARGLNLKCVLDGGADDGDWTRHIKSIYPEATVIAVEPREEPKLRELQQKYKDVFVEQCLLGSEPGQATLNVHGAQSSVLPSAEGQQFGQQRVVPVSTMDAIVERTRLPWPDLIKLDVQGYELEALKGAPRCLEHAQAILLELSFFRFQKGSPIAHEVIAFMADRGFLIYDVHALWQRPLDGALAQGDFLFLKATHPLLADNRWGAEASWS